MGVVRERLFRANVTFTELLLDKMPTCKTLFLNFCLDFLWGASSRNYGASYDLFHVLKTKSLQILAKYSKKMGEDQYRGS